MTRLARALGVACAMLMLAPPLLPGQEPGIERPAPPALEDFETDANKDGVPDGWYNQRDATLMPEGGVVGPHFLLHERDRGGEVEVVQHQRTGEEDQRRHNPQPDAHRPQIVARGRAFDGESGGKREAVGHGP